MNSQRTVLAGVLAALLAVPLSASPLSAGGVPSAASQNEPVGRMEPPPPSRKPEPPKGKKVKLGSGRQCILGLVEEVEPLAAEPALEEGHGALTM